MNIFVINKPCYVNNPLSYENETPSSTKNFIKYIFHLNYTDINTFLYSNKNALLKTRLAQCVCSIHNLMDVLGLNYRIHCQLEKLYCKTQ